MLHSTQLLLEIFIFLPLVANKVVYILRQCLYNNLFNNPKQQQKNVANKMLNWPKKNMH